MGKKNRTALITALVYIGFVVGTFGMVKQDASATIPPATYTPLLNTIAKGESNGNYNAYFGHSDNTTILFTEMTIAQVLKWQEDYVNGGSYSSAVGRYQIVRPTLAGLVKRHSIDLNAKYDEAMQDNLAIKLLERRGSVDYFEKKLTREQFAANLAQEWAALPKIIGENPEESYYAKDGVNKSRVTMAEIFQALASLEV